MCGARAMILAALVAELALLGALMNLAPACRLLALHGQPKWRLAALLLPGIGPSVFLWLVAFSGQRARGVGRGRA